ncbi:MAG: hypothetical protein U0R50_14270 [Gaiellales bacterium]
MRSVGIFKTGTSTAALENSTKVSYANAGAGGNSDPSGKGASGMAGVTTDVHPGSG